MTRWSNKWGNVRLVLFFTALTVVVTLGVIMFWEKMLLHPVFAWMDAHYGGLDPTIRKNYEQRVEHFFISTVVDVIVVSLLLRIVNRQQHELVSSEERYRAVFTHANDGIAVLTGPDHRLVEVNGRFAELLRARPEELIGRSLGNLGWGDGTDETPMLDTALARSDAGEFETCAKTAGGDICPVHVSFSTLAADDGRLIVLIVRDLSEQKKLAAEKESMQLQLFQASKLASIGELSAGVAHEINNPLNGIINFAQLLKDDGVAQTETHARMLDGIVDEGSRIAHIVRDLLTFARHGTGELRPVNVDDVINASVSLFGHQLDRDGVALEVHVEPGLPPVLSEGSRLRQVVVNMISNAHQALRESRAEEKVFRITASPSELNGRRAVRLDFYDNGVGIKPENLNRIFDPFFTTRRDSGGTGLGLSLSFGIVAEFGGTIRAESEVGRFTRFIIELPAAEPRESEHDQDSAR